MSDNQGDKAVGSENPPTPAQQPASPVPVYSMPLPPQQVACPNCYTLVPAGTHYCPQCGNAIPPPAWPSISPVPQPSKRNVALTVVAVVLITVLVLGVAGYLVYQNTRQQILQTAKNSEVIAANQSVDQLQFTCLTVRNDTSHLSYTAGSGFSGYLTVYETFGVSNPTSFVIDATWTFAIDFPSAGWVLKDTQAFHESANGLAYPIFAFTVTGSQYNNTPSNANFTRFSATLDGTYAVIGTYATYNPTTHSTYDSSTNTSSGSGASGGSGLPKC